MTAIREHVGENRSKSWLVKERFHCIIATLPLRYYHKMVVVHLVCFLTMLLTSVPAAERISENFSPRKIVISRQIDIKKDWRAMFSAYVEASTMLISQIT